MKIIETLQALAKRWLVKVHPSRAHLYKVGARGWGAHVAVLRVRTQWKQVARWAPDVSVLYSSHNVVELGSWLNGTLPN